MKTLDEIKESNRVIVGHIALDGGQGEIHMPTWSGSIIWSFGGGWEHVSVKPYKSRITPSWDDMCRIKDIFFKEDECVIQYHPAKSEYVNNVENCLHLWKPLMEKMPMPPSIMVGIRNGQDMKSAKKEMEQLADIDLLQGNINRMCVTDSIAELNSMYEWAGKRISSLFDKNYERIKSKINSGLKV